MLHIMSFTPTIHVAPKVATVTADNTVNISKSFQSKTKAFNVDPDDT